MKEDLIGIDILEEYILKCGDCGFPLVEIIKTETNEHRLNRGQKIQKSKFKAKCPKCGGWSFESPLFEGSTAQASVKEEYVLDMLDTEILDYKTRDDIIKGNCIISTTLELNKK